MSFGTFTFNTSIEIVSGTSIAAILSKGCEAWAKKEVQPKTREMVPVLTGRLRDSFQIEKLEDAGVRLSYNTPYAAKQHEEHKTKAKFLERAIQEAAERLPYYCEEYINQPGIIMMMPTHPHKENPGLNRE